MPEKADYYRALYGRRPENPPADGYGQHRPPTASDPASAPRRAVAGPAPAQHRPVTSPQYSSGKNPWEPSPLSSLEVGKGRRPGAKAGVRGRINRIFGTSLPPNQAEEVYETERGSIQAPIPTIKYVGVLHPKGGVGASIVLQMIGNTLAEHRREVVYAIDADHGGSLMKRTLDVSGTNSPKSTKTLYRWQPEGGEHFGSMFRRTPQGLMVIGNPKVTEDQPIEADELISVIQKFPREGAIRLIDMPHEDSPLFGPLLAGLSSIVLVTTPEKDSVELSKEFRNTIREYGRPDLVSSMVVVVNHRLPTDPLINEAQLAAVFEQGDDLGAATDLKRVLYTRYDEHIAEGGPIDYTLVDADSLKRYVSITAAVVARLTA